MSNKCKISLNSSEVVVDTDVALEMFKLLSKLSGEKLNYDYISSKESPTGDSQTLHYLQPLTNFVQLSNIADEDYAMWKLYGSTRGEKK